MLAIRPPGHGSGFYGHSKLAQECPGMGFGWRRIACGMTPVSLPAGLAVEPVLPGCFDLSRNHDERTDESLTMKRKASAIWSGDLKNGKGTLTTESGILRNTPYS